MGSLKEDKDYDSFVKDLRDNKNLDQFYQDLGYRGKEDYMEKEYQKEKKSLDKE